MAVYLASEHPLPLLPWDEAHPGFYVTGLDARDQSVRRQFSRPHVYYLGSHQGCGCGFQYGQYETAEEDPAEWAAAEEARRRLVAYVGAALDLQPEVEMFTCWGGDEAAGPEHRARVRLADLFGDRAYFLEREFLTVERSTPTP